MHNILKTITIMRAMNCNKIWAVLALSLFSGHVFSQRIHRYVLEVESVYQKQKVEATKDIHGNYWVEPKSPRRTVTYWEVLSKTPLTIQQCQDSIRLGKARRISNPRRRYHQQNLTMDGQIDNIWDQDIYMNDTYHEDPDLWDFLAD